MKWIAPRLGVIALAIVLILAAVDAVNRLALTGLAAQVAVGLGIAGAAAIVTWLSKKVNA